MSTSRLLKPGQRQSDYANVGYAGRKTGVILKDTGDRDEYGMPNIDDLFSPPPQPVPISKKISLPNGASKATAEDELDHGSGFQRDGTAYSSPRKSLPPRARSPIKTSIGSPRKSINGSPAKTMALLASPVRMQAPIQASSGVQGRSNGNTFMSTKHKRRSLEQAPKRPPTAAPVINKPKQQHTLRRSLFEVPSSPAIFEKASAQTNGVTAFEPARKGLQSTKSPRTTRTESAIASVSEALPYVNGQHNGEEGGGELFVKQRDSPLAASRNEHLVSIESPQRAKRRTEGKGKRRFSDIEAAERNPPPQPEVQLQDDEYEFQPDIEGFDDGEIDFGPDLDIPIEAEPNVEVQDHGNLTGLQAHPLKSVSTISRAQSNSPQAKFSLPNLKRRSPLDNDVQKETSPPTKKQRQPMLPPVKPIARAANERGKAKVITDSGKTRQEKYQPILEPVPEPAPPLSPFRKTRPKRRGLQIVKDKTVAEVDGARYTRSGRTSVKPVEYWRGERVIYSEPRREGGRVSLPGIMDVVRIEDGSQKTKSTKPSKSGRSRRRQPSVESQDDPEEEWEIEPGVFIGEVPYWDPIEQRGDPQYSEQVDLALAPSGLAALTKEVQGASFQFAKHLTLPFFHSGMLDLPPGGEKTSRNSRQFHMVFWVSSGRVAVDISGNKFTLGRGGIWQVPRGNSYSVKNPHHKPARIFFAQACYMTEAEGEAQEEAEAVRTAQE